ncbi:MAG: hypothetical protein JSV65_15510 [Armatimonadota bacterium]|nr:MAG: hypothetical protein JSV65_15510 [Armatimonadota bacterium]
MKGRTARPWWVLAIAAVVGLTGSASAVVLPFGDGFENIPAGAHPTANGWIPLRTGVSAYVSDEEAYADWQSFRLQSRPFMPRMEYVRLDELPDRVSYEGAVYLDAALGRVGLVGYMKAYFNHTFMWNAFQVDSRSGLVSFYGVRWEHLCSYTPGTWCAVRADLNYETLTADLWVNGVPVGSDVEITPKEFFCLPFGAVVLDQWGVSCPSNDDFTDPYMGNVVYFDSLDMTEWSGVTVVGVDVKPGSEVNPINLRARGVLPVAVLSAEGFDATLVDPSTVEVAGAGVAMRGKSGRYMAHFEDVDDDGMLDLLVQVEVQDLDPGQLQDGYAVVTGETYGGEAFQGQDDIVLIPRQ